MTDAGTLSEAVRSQARAWAQRGYIIALLSSVLVLIVTVPDASAALLTLPSLACAAALLLMPADRVGPMMYFGAGGVGLVTLVWAATTGESVIASVGLSACAALWIIRRFGRAVIPLLVAWVLISAISGIALFTVPDIGLRTLLLLSMSAGVWILAVVDSESHSRLFALMEQAKDAEGELSLLRERERFAADLHDIQGHSLHVVKLKAAVVEKTMAADAAQAQREIRAIQEITAEAIVQARELARASHVLDLMTEAHNAQNLLRSAGISAEIVDHHPTSSERDTPSTGEDQHRAVLLREATTNILRHSRASHVTIELSSHSLGVTNDGADETESEPRLRGLATLRRRITEVGGTLTITSISGTFCVRATFETQAPS